ncbi:DUF4968 domain-containing protein [Bacillus sp. HMF5848]|uniref:glycoside hydrolase family 31 protein n=1 Tax=Bacillus sp. HMF5848 TaxID=2495421 RepID=UPI000F77D66F|nr:glycoside hydrolase family 31 protein [Bacillus sp. HMF5848]RSK26400.1 DUF4968 domain-containing protein [Bacillus sp. HMF5848]
MLQDTSFAIHPGHSKKLQNSDYHDVGNVLEVTETANGATIRCEFANIGIRFYRDDIVRVVMNAFGSVAWKTSPAVISEPNAVEVNVTQTDDAATITSSAIQVVLQKSPLRITVEDANGTVIVSESEKGMGYKPTKEVICYKEMTEQDHFYGFGEKTGFLDKRGDKLEMWNTDVYAPHNPETNALYESIPFFMTLREGKAYGLFFDNTFKSTFDLQSSTNSFSFGAEGGQIDYYVMAGPQPKHVLEQYTSITGRAPIPPKWALGYHQSRYSYETETEVRELVKTFKEKGIPLDVVHLDIHYMDGYRVFTFDRDRFPTVEKLIEELRADGVRIVPIVDPGVKEDPEYPAYAEGVRQDMFCKYLEGNIYFGEVWPGNSAFPDFTSERARKWWGEKHAYYTDLGIEGIWNDMNEPAIFNETKTMDLKVMHDYDGDPRTHRELHNIYGLMMGKATYEGMKDQLAGRRPFLLTRAGYAGVQRYAAVWTGDNRSFWEHLQLSIPMCMNLGMSGVPFTGPDVGGFAHDSNGELLTRWTQVGTFTPFFRNHSAINTLRQEPWSFGEKYEAIIKKYIQLRYTWMPHLYSLFAEANQTGLPVMRPLVLEYPTDEHTFNLSDQFMIGSNVIVAPILQPSVKHRVVYLPEGQWVNYWTDEVLEGNKHHLVEADLDVLPIFVKQGSFVAHGEAVSSTAFENETLTLHFYKSEAGRSEMVLYEDDGTTFAHENGEFLKLYVEANVEETNVKVSVRSDGSYTPAWKQIQLVVHSGRAEDNITIDSELNIEIINK